jgi:hypothetical protein
MKNWATCSLRVGFVNKYSILYIYAVLVSVVGCLYLGQAQANDLTQKPVVIEQTQASAAQAQISMERGDAVRSEAKHLLKQARNQIQIANQINKDIRVIQKLLIDLKNQTKIVAALERHIKNLNQKRQSIQQQGADFRSMGERLLALGQEWMKQGFSAIWADKNLSLQPIQSQSHSTLMAHNTSIRSVKPNMPPASDPRLNIDEKIPSLMMQRGDQSRPLHLDTDPYQPSMQGHYFAHIVSQYNPEQQTQRPMNRVPINEMHNWLLLVTDAHGNKIEQLSIEIEGHMPGHVHGLPTAPEVTQELEPGVYQVRGVKFQMTGWWVMTFILKQGAAEDRVTFNLDL